MLTFLPLNRFNFEEATAVCVPDVSGGTGQEYYDRAKAAAPAVGVPPVFEYTIV
jgi:hypothetical protein